MVKKKVLIADDDDGWISTLIENMFPEDKYIVDSVSNADDLISYAKNNKYDLIVTDNEMNDGHGDSGVYAIKEIRKFDKDTPIVMNSSDRGFSMPVSAISAGASFFVRKHGVGETHSTGHGHEVAFDNYSANWGFYEKNLEKVYEKKKK